jgi:hypothetical protein
MSGNSVVQGALTNAGLKEQGVPDVRAKWVALVTSCATGWLLAFLGTRRLVRYN